MKAGDLITGIDRSYVRSIYRIGSLVPINGDITTYFVAYDGEVNEFKAIDSIRRMNPNELVNEFRLATCKEVQDAAFPEGMANVEAALDAGILYLQPNERFLFNEIKTMQEWKDSVKLTADEIRGFPAFKDRQIGIDFAFLPECEHEPVEYVGFNSVQTICKKCDKNL